MQLGSVRIDGSEAWGFVARNRLQIVDRWPRLIDAIAAGALDDLPGLKTGRSLALDDLEWLPVIGEPRKIFCVGLNYEKHRQETGRAVVDNPTIFTRFADSQVGHLGKVILPPESRKLDYEGELAVVIGRGGRRIAASEALGHVAGYSCYNDVSVRDWQAHSIQFIPGKNWPATGSFGPWMVTPDEFGALGPQRLQTRLNGQIMQDAHLGEMIFPVPRLIEYVSTFTPLSPGDVIVSGTPGGVGVKREPPVFMQHGDVVEVEIDGIGILTNTIAEEA